MAASSADGIDGSNCAIVAYCKAYAKTKSDVAYEEHVGQRAFSSNRYKKAVYGMSSQEFINDCDFVESG